MVRLRVEEIKGITTGRHEETECFAIADNAEVEYRKDRLFKENIFHDAEECHSEWPDE